MGGERPWGARGAGVVLAGLALLGAGCRRHPAGRAEPLNVVLVVMDTVRADHLGAYGYARPTTPNLDALAQQGVLFENVISPAATTSPSIGSMMTGVLPSRHGVRAIESVSAGRLDPALPTVAERLRMRGYATGAFVASVTASSLYGFDRGFGVYEERAVREQGQVAADQVNAALLPWLEHRPSAGRFFVFVHYFDVHDLEVRAPKPWFGRFTEPGMTELQRRIAQYDGELQYLDSRIGELVKAIDASPFARQTAIVVLADHGEGLGQHGQMAHGLLYQEQVRVPFIVRGPGFRRGARVSARLSALNLAPTLLDLAGAPSAAGSSAHLGHSLRPWLEGRRGTADDLVIAESHNVFLRRPGPASVRGEVYAVLRGDWKYVHYPRGPRSELYRLDEDPEELRDRAPENPAVVGALHELLVKLDVMRPLAPAGRNAVPAERMEQLRTLGYVE